jgi:acetate kinase
MAKILVINCGSSSLKYEVYEMPEKKSLGKGLVERIGDAVGKIAQESPRGEYAEETPIPDHRKAMELVRKALTDSKAGIIASLDEIAAAGHRVVHGGEYYAESVLIDDKVIETIDKVSELAPLHNPPNLTGIKETINLLGKKPQVAVFDTAFHQTLPPAAYLYGIPRELYDKYRIRRYGFHGTSHRYVAAETLNMLGRSAENTNIISCHLGNGASITAVKNGKSVDTSMGFTPLEGLVMGTRSGDIDPAILEYLAGKENLDITGLISMLNKKSGVFGLSGNLSSDFRDLENAANSGNKKAEIAVSVFAYRVAKYIGSYVAAMNGVDVIAFTAGIGENSGYVREKIIDYLGYLGVKLDKEANKARGEEIALSTPDSNVKVLVIPTNEELAIARETVALL